MMKHLFMSRIGAILFCLSGASSLPAMEIFVADAYRDAVYHMTEVDGSGLIDAAGVHVAYDDAAAGPDLSTPADMVLVDGALFLLDGGSLDTIFRWVDEDDDASFLSDSEWQVFLGPDCGDVALRTPNRLIHHHDRFVLSDDSSTRGQIIFCHDVDGDGAACLLEESTRFYDSRSAEGTEIPSAPSAICVLADDSVLAADSDSGHIYRLADLDQDGVASRDDEITLFYRAPDDGEMPVFSCILLYRDGFLAADSRNGGILYLADANGDGMVDPAAEVVQFCGQAGRSVYIGEPMDLWLDDLGHVWVVDNATDGIFFVADWNDDGDAVDPGEALLVLRDDSILSRPSALVVKGAPQGIAPSVQGLSTGSGSVEGGEEVVLSGAHFTAGTVVYVGDQPADAVAVVDSETIRMVMPAGSGTVSVTAASIHGRSVLADAWTYAADGLTVTGMSPGEGLSSGGYPMTIMGTGLDHADVWIDDVPVEITQQSGRALVVIVPPHAPGEVMVRIDDGLDHVVLPFIYTASGTLFVRGDMDGNGGFALNDAIMILSVLFANEPRPACEDRADVNDDGSLNLADAIALLGYLFTDGEAPPAPFPEPGVDETPDDLTCP